MAELKRVSLPKLPVNLLHKDTDLNQLATNHQHLLKGFTQSQPHSTYPINSDQGHHPGPPPSMRGQRRIKPVPHITDLIIFALGAQTQVAEVVSAADGQEEHAGYFHGKCIC
jgi:hypothetical protein